MAAPVQVARQQTTPELSGTFWTLASDPIPTLAGTLRIPPELSEPCLWNLHQHAPELSGTLQNLPRPSGTNLSEPTSGTYLRNLRQHMPEPSGTFRNPAPEPTPAHAGTLRNLPEPSSGTCSCDPHRHTPVLIWAEDPISLCCWGKMTSFPHVISHSTAGFISNGPGLTRLRGTRSAPRAIGTVHARLGESGSSKRNINRCTNGLIYHIQLRYT